MITGELKGKVEHVWDAFWSGGTANPLEVVEQIYVLFLPRRDDLSRRHVGDLNALFESLQHRAFRGEL